MMKKLVSLALCAALLAALLAGAAGRGLPRDRLARGERRGQPRGERRDRQPRLGRRPRRPTTSTPRSSPWTAPPVSWGEFFYWFYYCYAQYSGVFGAVADFNAEYIYAEDSTVGSVIMDEAKNYAVQYHALDVNAQKEGIALTARTRRPLPPCWRATSRSWWARTAPRSSSTRCWSRTTSAPSSTTT